MVRLFDGEVEVAYYQFYVETPEVIPGADVAQRFAGQTNGLCGAGEAGMLQCTTGLHTGPVPLTVDLLDTAPAALEDGWEEVVEVSLTTTTPTVLLYDSDHQNLVELPFGQGSLRIRYHATGLEAGRDADVRMPDEPVLDRYLLQVWPAEPAPDAVLRETSDLARYWHDTARNTPGPSTAAAGEGHDGEDRELAAFRQMIADVTGSSPADQRAAACWLARQAAEAAGPAVLAWIEPAVAALERGDPLPEPFADPDTARVAAPRAPSPAPFDGDVDGAEGDLGQATTEALGILHAAADADPTRAFMHALARTQIRDGLRERETHAALRARFTTS